MLLFRNLSTFLFETPDPAGSGGAGQPAPGTAPVGQGQPPAGGQPPQDANAGFWNLFPNVPQEHRALIEPHMGQVMGHVTQLEQQVAPLRQLQQAGYDSQTLQGLVQFDQRFNQAPLDTWLELGRQLQQAPQTGGNPALDPQVDLDYLAAIARGEDPDAPGSVPGTQPGADPAQQGAQDPAVQQLLSTVQALQQKIQGLEQSSEQERVQRQTAISDQVFDRRLTQMRGALKEAGWPEDLVDPQDPQRKQQVDRWLTASVVTHRGDFAAAAKTLIDQRSGLLQGFTTQATEPNQGRRPTNLPNGAPPSPDRDLKPRDRGDSFKRASKSAEARLKRLNAPG